MTATTSFLCEGCHRRFLVRHLWQRTRTGRWFPLRRRLAAEQWHGSPPQCVVYAMACSAACLRLAPRRTLADWQATFRQEAAA